MKMLSCICAFIALILFVAIADGADNYTCVEEWSACLGQTLVCPPECPYLYSANPKAKVCHLSCERPHCRAQCKHRKPNCNSPGSACYDPRFIGADGIVFYFHGKSNEHFSLVSDRNLQINGRFIGHRPAGRRRDFTWIQALGILFNSHSFSLEAAKTATWDEKVDHLRMTFDGEEINVPEDALSTWSSPEQRVKVERTSDKNSVIVNIPGVVEILINVVPVTKEDDRVHSYKVPSDDCFAHLEVQFRFGSLSPKVEGVLGRTYQPDFENPAKPGVAMAVLGGEDKYRTTSLLSADCATCIYSPIKQNAGEEISRKVDYGTLDCTSKLSRGNGIVCKK